MISAATLDELAGYAAAGRIGDRVGQVQKRRAENNGALGAWVFGLTLLSVFAVTAFQGCQRQTYTPQAGQEIAVRQRPVASNDEVPTRKAPVSSPTPDRISRPLARPRQPVAPIPNRPAMSVATPVASVMWRDPRGYVPSSSRHDDVNVDSSRISLAHR